MRTFRDSGAAVVAVRERGRPDREFYLGRSPPVSPGRLAWAPDGRRLAFVVVGTISVLDVASGEQRAIANDAGRDTLSWSPDGRLLAYSANSMRLAVAAADGSGTRDVTERDAFEPSFSPDGRELAFVGWRPPLRSATLHVVAVDGTDERRLLATPAWPDLDSGLGPQWSPDGSTIAFTAFRPRGAGRSAGPGQIHAVRRDGSGERALTAARRVTLLPRWSPDGSRLAFTSNRGGTHDVYVMNRDGTCETQLTSGGGYRPAWQPLAGAGAEAPLHCAELGIDGGLAGGAGVRGGYVYRLRVANDGTLPGSARLLGRIGQGAALTAVGVGGEARRCVRDERGLECALGRIAPGSAVDVAVHVRANRSGEKATWFWLAAVPASDRNRSNDVLALRDRIACRAGASGGGRLVGTAAADLLCGRRGADVVLGLGGDDELHGGPGRDLLSGGPGDDVIRARDGEGDTIVCGPGRDRVVADRLDVVARDCEVVVRR